MNIEEVSSWFVIGLYSKGLCPKRNTWVIKTNRSLRDLVGTVGQVSEVSVWVVILGS